MEQGPSNSEGQRMSIKAVPISAARQIGQKANATRIAVFAIDETGRFCITTWGKTRADCRAAATFAEGRLADLAIEGLSGMDANCGLRDAALDPNYE
ncbi:MAG: hypothetical protein GXP05_04335 [Alphaproteobacteria bacterium]|nr:hypothetical protein [Alphaproteobacteria bacterium]